MLIVLTGLPLMALCFLFPSPLWWFGFAGWYLGIYLPNTKV